MVATSRTMAAGVCRTGEGYAAKYRYGKGGGGVKAVVYKEPHTVEVEEVPDPRIESPTDVIIRVTSTAICGSDLHMYEGRTAAEPGTVFGHENMGVDRGGRLRGSACARATGSSMPFNVACGFCKNCLAG